MKRIYTVLTSAVLGLLFVFGVVALFSPSSSAQKPKLTFSALLNGSFYGDYRTY